MVRPFRGLVNIGRQLNPPADAIHPVAGNKDATDDDAASASGTHEPTASFQSSTESQSATAPGLPSSGNTLLHPSLSTAFSSTENPSISTVSTTRSNTSTKPSPSDGWIDSPSSPTRSNSQTRSTTRSTTSSPHGTHTPTSSNSKPPTSTDVKGGDSTIPGGEEHDTSHTKPTTTTDKDSISKTHSFIGASPTDSPPTSTPTLSVTEPFSQTPPDQKAPLPATSPSLLADRPNSTSVLHNTTASALIFTFTGILAVVLLGLLLYCSCWRRRMQKQHVMLGDDDSDGRIGILRADSTGSHSSRRHRPMSATSALSSGTEGHYLPARFAGVLPVSRHPGFDTTRIERDPFSVHRVVYPDMPPGSEENAGRYTLYPDPALAPAPMRAVSSSPLHPPAAIATRDSWPTPTSIAPLLRSPKRVKVPSLAPHSPSSHGHEYEADTTAASSQRGQSPESHYDEDSIYSAPRRTYLIDRRPEKRFSQ